MALLAATGIDAPQQEHVVGAVSGGADVRGWSVGFGAEPARLCAREATVKRLCAGTRVLSVRYEHVRARERAEPIGSRFLPDLDAVDPDERSAVRPKPAR